MLSPKTGLPMHEVAGEAATYTLRGLQFEISGSVWECSDTGTRYHTPEQANALLARLHQAWRERHGIGATALYRRRKQLGLSAAQASALLGLGVNQYRTYEQTDRLPSKSNARLLRLLLDDQALLSLAQAASEELPAPARRKLQAYLARPIHRTIIPRLSNQRFVASAEADHLVRLSGSILPIRLLDRFMYPSPAIALA